MANFRTTNKKQLAARVLCGLLLSTYLTGVYSLPVAWGAPDGNGAKIQGNSVTASGTASSAWGYYAKAYGNYTTAFGSGTAGVEGDATKGEYATAFGITTTASGEDSTAFGYQSEASGDESTAFGIKSIASGNGATAWGKNSVAGGNYATAFGDSSKAMAEKSLAALGGVVEKDATNGVAIGKGASVSSADSIAIGTGLKVSGKNSGAFGDPDEVSGSNSYAFGNNNTVSGDNTFVLGNNVSTGAKNAVVLGDGSEGVDDAVSFGAKGKERQIKNVAPGTDDSDVATVGQTRVTKDGKYVKKDKSAGENLTELDKAVEKNAADIADLQAVGGADLAPINRRIDNLDSKVNKVGAGAAALAALHPMDTDGKFSMAAGFGNYRDANAMALGLFYRPNDQVMFSMGGSLGNGENLLNVGVSFALDKGVNTSKAAMAKKIAAQDEKIVAQDAEFAALKEALAHLEAKLGK